MNRNYMKTEESHNENNKNRALSQNYYKSKRKYSMINNIYNELEAQKNSEINSYKNINFLNMIKISGN